MSCATPGFDVLSNASTSAKLAAMPDLKLRSARELVLDRVEVFQKCVVWPALAESWNRDLAAINAEMARRAAA